MPHALQLGKLPIATHHRQQSACGNRRREAGRGRGVGPEPFDQLPRLARSGDAELATQPLSQRPIDAQRSSAIPDRIQARDQPSVRLLIERGAFDLAPSPIDRVTNRAPLIALAGQSLEQPDHLLAVTLARCHRPLVLHALEQLAAAERQRVLGRGIDGQPLELAGVDPQVRVRAKPYPLTVDDQTVAEGSAQRPQRAAQTGPGALIKHVRPEPRGQLSPGYGPLGERQVGKHGPGAL